MNVAPSRQTSALDEGRKVIEIEAAALLALARDMPPDYEAVVELILTCRGRVVVSGIGKSGHVGRKIAATLASTGTAAHFVHAAEASHGDLGMVSRDDVCLLLSNSGETAELRDIVAYSRRFAIPMVAVCAAAHSTLARAADHCLILPPAPEACPTGLVPTTSTTMTLALGDALAVSLMTRRGFVSDDFRVLHPGGRLGAQLSRVADLMHASAALPLVAPDADMAETLLTMTSRGFGIAGVVADGRLVGVISDGDLRRNMADLMRLRAGDIANPAPVTVPADMLAARALGIMNDRKITVLFVVEGDAGAQGVPVGVLHLHDCLRAGVA